MTDPLVGGHLEIEILADLDEGLLTPIETAAADEHLRLCIACREQRARLSSTRAQLAALPKVPMPPEVARRLETAIQGAAATVVPMTDRPRRPWRAHPTAAGLAAAAAVAGLVAAIVVGAFGHSRSAPSASSTTAEGPGAALSNGASANFPVTVTDNNYTPAHAGELVQALITSQQKVGVSTPGPASAIAPTPSEFGGANAAPVAASLTKLYTDRNALEACVRALEPPPFEPLVVDFGQYTNPDRHLFKKPAMILVFANQVGSNSGAYIVGPGCATAPDNNLYLFQVVPSG